MSLSLIAAAIKEQIATDMDPEPPPAVLFGASEIYRGGTPPRIVFVPTTERIVPPTGQGGDGISNPRPLWVRRATVEAHIWGKDSADTERFLSVLVQALHDLAWGSYVITGGNWANTGEAKSDKGEVYVLTMEWHVPITRAPDTFAVVNTMPLDPLTVDT